MTGDGRLALTEGKEIPFLNDTAFGSGISFLFRGPSWALRANRYLETEMPEASACGLRLKISPTAVGASPRNKERKNLEICKY